MFIFVASNSEVRSSFCLLFHEAPHESEAEQRFSVESRRDETTYGQLTFVHWTRIEVVS